jgi:putative flippase GtrA
VKRPVLSRDFAVQTLRFLVAGLAGTAIYAGCAFGLAGAGVSVLWAHSIAYIASILASYFGQKIFTFQIRGDHRRNGPRFVIATIALAATQFALVAGLNAARLPETWTLLASTLFYPPASFLVHTFWTFRTPVRPS